ncbi:EamA family transporter [Campylobacterota bacterium DY0563]
MSFSVMLIVFFAALLHASWNFLVKSNSDKHISMSAVVLGHTPFALFALFFVPLPNLESLPYIISGALLHTGYQLFLLKSYKIGDLSQVYPLARGVAPLLVAIVSVFILGKHLNLVETTAIIVICTGIMSLVLVRKNDGLRNYKAAVLAVITGIFIASYSIIDGMGARISNSPVGFYGYLSILNAVFFLFIVSFKKPETFKVVTIKNYKLALAGGLFSFVAYSLIIWAFTMAPIALVTALRETSIIFALFLGVFILKEKLDLVKFFASMCTLIGAGLLKFSR